MRKVNFDEFVEIRTAPFVMSEPIMIYHNTPFSVEDFFKKWDILFFSDFIEFGRARLFIREYESTDDVSLNQYAESEPIMFVYGYDGNNGNPMSPYTENSKFLCIYNSTYRNRSLSEMLNNRIVARDMCNFCSVIKLIPSIK